MSIFVAADHVSTGAAAWRLASYLAEGTPKPSATLLSGIAELVSALAWPILAAVLLITQRKPLEKLIGAIVSLAESANKIKIWVLEVERQITQEVNRSEMLAQATASGDPKTGAAPGAQAEAATRVGRLIEVIPPSAARDKALQSVKENMQAFAEEYDAIRASMSSGSQRTIRMNAVAAKMRTLAIAAKPFLKEFSSAAQPGKRLAAICILEIAPDLAFLDWLVARMSVEAPFVFFHASIALSATVKAYKLEASAQLSKALTDASNIVRSYAHGPPDENTLNTLEEALKELEQK